MKIAVLGAGAIGAYVGASLYRAGAEAAQNGIPWWYFHGLPGPYSGYRIESVDPGGAVTAVLPPHRAIGCVVYAATEIESPGVVRHLEGTRLSIGRHPGVGDCPARNAPVSTRPPPCRTWRRGRPLELDVLLTAVVELADLTGAEVPTLRVVAAIADLLNRQVNPPLNAP